MYSNPWLRLWVELPHDPKFRVIAKVAGLPVSLVISVYIYLLCDAGNQDSSLRGISTCRDEEIAITLDCDIDQVLRIKEAMQGRLLDGSELSGWKKRQPKKEDAGNEEVGSKSATERKAAQRKRESLSNQEAENQGCHEMSRDVTECHGLSRDVTIEKRREEEELKTFAQILQFARTDSASALAPALAESVTASPNAALQAVTAGLGIAKPAEAATGTAVSLLAMLSSKFKQSLANTGDSALAPAALAQPALAPAALAQPALAPAALAQPALAQPALVSDSKFRKVSKPLASLDGFAEFYAAYPRKRNKGHAEKAWLRLSPDADLQAVIHAAIGNAIKRDDWRKEGGAFIPYPATWLNSRGWEDEVVVQAYPEKYESVFATYNAIMTKAGWPEACATPFVPSRAAAIGNFIELSNKPDWMNRYFGIVAKTPPYNGCGFDWVIKPETFLKFKEDQFKAKQQ
jgi:hypothetical protein